MNLENNKINVNIIKEENNIKKSEIDSDNIKKKKILIKSSSKQNIRETKEKSQGKLRNKKLKLENSPTDEISKNHTKHLDNNIIRKKPEIDGIKKHISKTIDPKNDNKSKSNRGNHKFENQKNKKIKVLYKNPQNIDSKFFTHSNNLKNTHKIINRKRGINLSTKSLDINTYSNNNNKINNLNKNKNTSNQKKNNIDQKNENKPNITNYKTKKIKEINIAVLNNNNDINQTQKENNEINKTYSESDLGEVGGEIIEDDESEKENEIDELDELNETNKIYYYDPKSIVNYSSINFTNRKNRKHQSLSVSKENTLYNSIFNKTINKIINQSIFKFSDMSLNRYMDIPSQEQDLEKKNKEIKNINEKINIKNKDIEKINKLIENIKKQIKKYDKEIRTIDNYIQQEENEGDMLRQLINFFNTK